MPTKQTLLNQSKYDTLLEEFLPAIHKAACAAQKEQMTKDIPITLILAGVRGLKEAIVQFSEANQSCDRQKVFLRSIHCSMRQQIGINNPSMEN